jgi:hypothetical protein
MMANLNGSSTAGALASASQDATTTTVQDDLQRVNEFFEANSGAIERWLREKASDEVIRKLNNIIKSKEQVVAADKEHRSSVTSELYQQWLSSSVKVSDRVSREGGGGLESLPSEFVFFMYRCCCCSSIFMLEMRERANELKSSVLCAIFRYANV